MNTRTATTALMGLLLLVLPAGRATAQEVAYPKGAPGVVNVRDDYGARGDGIADDTESIKAAFKKLSFSGNLLYFPNGTYLVSDQVWFACWCGAQGQSREKVIIKLKDNCPRFQDPKNPKAVVGTVDPASNRKACLNMNFSTYFINFTIDTGKGNPGAIALEYMSHNGGCAENLVLRSGDGAGYCGLAMDRLGPGPSMCKNIAIEGFDYGVITEGNCYQSTFENIRLSGQRVAGWLNTDHPLTVRKLVSTSAVPAVLCRKTAAWRHPGPDAKGGFFVMLDSQLSGGTAEAAVDIQDGAVFLRNVKIDGYKAAVNNKGTLLSDRVVKEYSSQPWDSTIQRTLNLPVKDTPAMPWYDHKDWANVQDYKDKVARDGDWAPAFQAAIDAGKPVVFVPKGRYGVKQTVHLRGKARVLLGTVITSIDCARTGQPTFLFDNPDPAAVFFIDRIRFEGDNGLTKVVHTSPGTLVVLHGLTITYSNGPGCGELFIEDMCGNMRFEHPQKVWIRQLNTEGGGLKVLNKAADLWIMSYKTEGTGIELHNGPSARTEILGANNFTECYDQRRFDADTGPMYLNEDGGAFSAVVAIEWTKKLMVKDMQGGKAKTIESGAKPGQRRWMLYTSMPRGAGQ